MDNFGVTYTEKEHAENLMTVLGKYYNPEEDDKDKLYCEIYEIELQTRICLHLHT